MKVLCVGGAMIDTIAIIDRDRIERVTTLNADTSFLLLEQGRKTEAEEVSTHPGGGAVNAAVVAYGMAVGGREAAKKTLDRYWRRLSEMASVSIFQPSLFDKMDGNFGLDHSPGYFFVDSLSQIFSPYQLNPFNYNPFKNLLEEVIDFELLRQQQAVKLFLCATNVRSGKVKIFGSEELRSDHVVASSCQPLMMHAVEIEGEHYWDGGFMGNPAIFPVIYACEARDIILVHLTPIERTENPTNSRTIFSRMQEVTFNSSLMREMRAIAFFSRLIDEARLTGGKRVFVHSIDGEDIIGRLPNSSKMNGTWELLTHLNKLGRERADDWLKHNFECLGQETTIDLETRFL